MLPLRTLFLYHLHSLSPNEIEGYNGVDWLLEFGGFPEPCYENDKRFWPRWQNLGQKRLIEEDLIYLETLKDFSQVEALMSILPGWVPYHP